MQKTRKSVRTMRIAHPIREMKRTVKRVGTRKVMKKSAMKPTSTKKTKSTV